MCTGSMLLVLALHPSTKLSSAVTFAACAGAQHGVQDDDQKKPEEKKLSRP